MAAVDEQTQLLSEPRGAKPPARRSRGPRITQRDVAMVRWIARWRFASVPQVRARFGLGQSVAYRRLGQMAEMGCLEFRRLFVGRPGVYTVTDVGLGLCEVDLPRVGVSTCSQRTGSPYWTVTFGNSPLRQLRTFDEP